MVVVVDVVDFVVGLFDILCVFLCVVFVVVEIEIIFFVERNVVVVVNVIGVLVCFEWCGLDWLFFDLGVVVDFFVNEFCY